MPNMTYAWHDYYIYMPAIGYYLIAIQTFCTLWVCYTYIHIEW